MKDPNFLEAIDLCMNGNPVIYPQSDINIRRKMYFLEALIECYKITQPCPSFEKGSHLSRPVGEGPEPIIMPSGYVGFSREKQNDIDRIKRAQKLSYVLAKVTKESERLKEAMTFEEMSNGEKVLVFINHKALRKLIHGKKRYSISTPIVRM